MCITLCNMYDYSADWFILRNEIGLVLATYNCWLPVLSHVFQMFGSTEDGEDAISTTILTLSGELALNQITVSNITLHSSPEDLSAVAGSTSTATPAVPISRSRARKTKTYHNLHRRTISLIQITQTGWSSHSNDNRCLYYWFSMVRDKGYAVKQPDYCPIFHK